MAANLMIPMKQQAHWLMCMRENERLREGNGEYSSWEEHAFQEDPAGLTGDCTTWPPRSYACTFCRRAFRSAQALGGHMNVHRRDRARLRQSSLEGTLAINPSAPNSDHQCNPELCVVYPVYPVHGFPHEYHHSPFYNTSISPTELNKYGSALHSSYPSNSKPNCSFIPSATTFSSQFSDPPPAFHSYIPHSNIHMQCLTTSSLSVSNSSSPTLSDSQNAQYVFDLSNERSASTGLSEVDRSSCLADLKEEGMQLKIGAVQPNCPGSLGFDRHILATRSRCKENPCLDMIQVSSDADLDLELRLG
eukprot:Gb_27734 [translate_table: standard]